MFVSFGILGVSCFSDFGVNKAVLKFRVKSLTLLQFKMQKQSNIRIWKFYFTLVSTLYGNSFEGFTYCGILRKAKF